MAELTSLRNIGAQIQEKLKSAGITTAEELKRIGSKEAFLQLKLHCPSVCLVHLYSLEGAVSGIEYNQLPKEIKQNLKDFSDGLK